MLIVLTDYTNVLYSSYMPILSSSVFDNTGKPYDVSRILTSDFMFNKDEYERYSRVFMPITYVLSYALQFASLTALITHTACWHGRAIWKQSHGSFAPSTETAAHEYEPVATQTVRDDSNDKMSHKSSNNLRRPSQPPMSQLMDAEDVHNRLMRRYEDVPVSWYLLTGLVTVIVGIFVVE